MASDVFRIKIFSDKFLQKLNNEIDNAEYMRKTGSFSPNDPNTMNKYGFRLRELGFFSFIDDFALRIRPVLQLLFPSWRGDEVDFVHPFIISYENSETGQVKLDTHLDDAEITLNICIKGY